MEKTLVFVVCWIFMKMEKTKSVNAYISFEDSNIDLLMCSISNLRDYSDVHNNCFRKTSNTLD